MTVRHDRGNSVAGSAETSEFQPSWWLPGPHLQTLAARALRSVRDVPFTRERVELPDGDFVDLDFPFGLDGPDVASPLTLVLHGLEGSARSGYAVSLYRYLRELGVSAVGLNFRSCSGELNRLPRLYHSGETGDLAFVLRWLSKRFDERPIGVVGFSLGGNVTLKYLGERGGAARTRVSAAAAISVPYDLGRGATHLERLGGRGYARFLLRKLQRKVVAKKEMLIDRVDYERGVSATTFRDFDDAVTAKLHDFAGADDYYARSSSAGYISQIAVDTLLIHAYDDPFLPRDAIPENAAGNNPVIATAFLPRGGHVGFVSGRLPWRPVFWAEREAARFMARRLSKGGRTDAMTRP